MKRKQKEVETDWFWNFNDDIICNKQLCLIILEGCLSWQHNKDIIIFCFIRLHITILKEAVANSADWCVDLWLQNLGYHW